MSDNATECMYNAGASDDIRRATELAYRSVSEFGLSAAVGPLAVASMGGDDGALMLRDSGSYASTDVPKQVDAAPATRAF